MRACQQGLHGRDTHGWHIHERDERPRTVTLSEGPPQSVQHRGQLPIVVARVVDQLDVGAVELRCDTVVVKSGDDGQWTYAGIA